MPISRGKAYMGSMTTRAIVASEAERTKLVDSLKAAEARIKAGMAVDYDSDTFKRRLIEIYRRSER